MCTLDVGVFEEVTLETTAAPFTDAETAFSATETASDVVKDLILEVTILELVVLDFFKLVVLARVVDAGLDDLFVLVVFASATIAAGVVVVLGFTVVVALLLIDDGV